MAICWQGPRFSVAREGLEGFSGVQLGTYGCHVVKLWMEGRQRTSLGNRSFHLCRWKKSYFNLCPLYPKKYFNLEKGHWSSNLCSLFVPWARWTFTSPCTKIEYIQNSSQLLQIVFFLQGQAEVLNSTCPQPSWPIHKAILPLSSSSFIHNWRIGCGFSLSWQL